MARSLGGLDLQASIEGRLQKFKFSLQSEEDWDHNNKIDFVITKFPNYPKSISLGVQVTSRAKDTAKISEFVAKNDLGNGCITVADKVLYLEYDENVDLNRGGAELVANALYSFQFDAHFAQTKLWAVAIQALPDAIGYRFFDPRKPDLPASAARDSPPPAAASKLATAPLADLNGAAKQLGKSLSGIKAELEGRLHTWYTEKGYGFIDAQDGSTYFLHFAGVEDKTLAGDLEALMKLPGKTPLHYAVLFENGGKTRPGALYKTARKVRKLV